MNRIIILIGAALIALGCNGAARQTAETNNFAGNSNGSSIVQTNDNQAVVSSHSGDAEKTVSPRGDAPSTGSPMARPIDVSQMTADIERAEKEYKKNPKAKEALAKAYFVRATALTEAAQYRQALGDYRKGLKLDPNDEAARGMHDQIISIFQQIGREPPKEGEEPPPLPFEKQTSANDDSRIVFEKGATEAVAKGSLKNYDDSKTFVIDLRAGQTLKTEQLKSDDSTHYITVGISDPKGATVGDSDASCNNRKEIKPTVAGDYEIEVTECRKADMWSGDFQLKISVK